MRKLNYKAFLGLCALLLILPSLLLSACPGKAPTTGGDQLFTIKIGGDTAQAFTGNYVLMTASGGITNTSISGTAPKDYTASGLQVDLTVQKGSAAGYLEIQILKGKDVVGKGSISAAFGSITLIGH